MMGSRASLDHWIIEDLGSYNGVRVNGQPTEGHVTLREGDVVQIGDYHLALTEDVDKRTLNFDAPSEPANDAGEPLLASSSTDLPRLSAEELAALQSGPHTPQGSPAMLDSGPMAAQAMPAYPPRSSSSGMLLGFGIVIVVALGAGLFWMINQDGDKRGADTKTASGAAPKPETKTPPPPQPDPDTAVAVVEPSDGGEPDPLANGSGAVPEGADDDGAIDAVPEPVPVPEPDDPPEPIDTTPKTSKQTTPKKPKTEPPKDRPRPQPSEPEPPPPPAPAVDEDALIAEAKKLAFSNPSKAYSLANDAFRAGGSQEAAAIMVSTACKMKDEGKAKRAFKKLKGSKRDDAIKLCKLNGIELQ